MTLYARFAEAEGRRRSAPPRSSTGPAGAPSPAQRRNRLLTLRRFALAMQAEIHVTRCRRQTPSAGRSRSATCPISTLPRRSRACCGPLPGLAPTDGLRPIIYATLFGLLAATGLRISEALALRLNDITDDGMVVHETKLAKSRLVPLHEKPAKP